MEETFSREAINRRIATILEADHDSVNRICHPLFKNTPIDYFSFQRVYDDARQITLTSKPEFPCQFFKEDLPPTLQELNLFNQTGLEFTYLSDGLELPPAAADLNPEKYRKNIEVASDFSVFNRLYWIRRGHLYYELFGFGCFTQKKYIFDFYINMKQSLQKFANYFVALAKGLIEKQEMKGLTVVYNYLNTAPDVKQTKSEACSISSQQLFALFDHPLDLPMTCREKQCVNLLAKGYTMKMIAAELKLSPRTVEEYIQNIKTKTNLSTKDLVLKWHKANLFV